MSRLILITTATGLLLAPFAMAQDPRNDTGRRTQDPGTRVAEQDRARAQQQMREPKLLAADDVIGAEIVDASGKEVGQIADLEVDAKTGRIHKVKLENGQTSSMEKLTWLEEEEKFRTTGMEGRPTDASGRRTDAEREAAEAEENERTGGEMSEEERDAREALERAREGAGAGMSANKLRRVELSKVDGAKLISTGEMRREETGDEDADADLGTVGGAYVDVNNGYVMFVTTSVGGVLGIGADSKLIPWSMAEFEKSADDEDEIRVTVPITEEKLENAPSVEDGEKLKNPAKCREIYSYYGVQPPGKSGDHGKKQGQGYDHGTDKEKKQKGRDGYDN